MSPPEPDSEIGSVELHRSAKIVFSIRHWNGQPYAHVRKFVSTARYEGWTKSGLVMARDVLTEVMESLVRLQAEVPGTQEHAFARIARSGGREIVISIVPPNDLNALPAVDVREYSNTPEYTGPTKKGIRFSWDKLPHVIRLLQLQAKQLRECEPTEPTTPPAPTPPPGGKEPLTGTPSTRDDIFHRLLPEGPKDFPRDFLEGEVATDTVIDLPPEPIEVAQQPDGTYVVRSPFGFFHPVRNSAEGNLIVYAHLRGHRTVHLPHEMIAVFRAVTGYKNYLHQLRHSLIQAYERKSGYRPMAEHQAKEVFREYGLPWIESS